ncbi:unnamed protein product [Phytophthora lilii]|uniref:Unnamed protein product n=1 Tax=Phytophthora lilii TaxID=2077276 RepID=A0A9W6X6I3_9STRA|nr:unnamed protein product [Phytophthora lilii]
MAVQKINAAIRHLDWDAARRALLRDDDISEPEPIKVCSVSANDWNRYVRSDEYQKVEVHGMEDGTVWLVKYGWSIHGSSMSVALVKATGTFGNHLLPHGGG